MQKIYTKTGDSGKTTLLGGKRVSKASAEIIAIGSVDELNAAIGLFAAHIGEKLSDKIVKHLNIIQHILFRIGGQLAAIQTTCIVVPKVTATHISDLELWIDKLEKELVPLTQFILPFGYPLAAESFFVRAICRRAEWEVIALYSFTSIDPLILAFLNRLSDLLFVLGRMINKQTDTREVLWKK